MRYKMPFAVKVVDVAFNIFNMITKHLHARYCITRNKAGLEVSTLLYRERHVHL